jgi:hypothetical protein
MTKRNMSGAMLLIDCQKHFMFRISKLKLSIVTLQWSVLKDWREC